MLLNVNVKNLALIKKADVCFNEGLNIMTGETGAGKSIIIGSILIALGGKIPKDIIREEEKEALVELVFQVKDSDTIEKLREQNVVCEDGLVIISRKITNGRSMIRVNGENFTSANLKKVTELLIDIHGQHDHQSLLKKSKHLEILDNFAANEIKELLREIKSSYKEYTKLAEELSEYTIDEDERKREIDFCTYEIEEISLAELKDGEYEKIEDSYKLLSNSKNIMFSMNQVYDLLDNMDNGAISSIGGATKAISSVAIYDNKIEDIRGSLLELESIAADCVRTVKDYMDAIAFDEDYITQVENRIDSLNRLKQKYIGNIATDNVTKKILEHKEKLEEKLAKLVNFENIKNELNDRLKEKEKELSALSEKLTKLRKSNALELQKKFVSVLQGLNFIEVNFSIEFKKLNGFTANGRDEIEFMISTNKGEPLRPLAKIASGGELSRIMLGIKTILASKDRIDTLIFDEIDTGISGRTAQMVAERMKEISKVHQIICITHLPQIASMADTHFLIEKNVIKNETLTDISELNYDNSIEELARMLSGSEVTKAVVDNAKEMKLFASKI